MLAIDVKAEIGALRLVANLPAAGGITVVVGPNGAGKSTLLRCLLGAMRPSSGSIKLGDRVLFDGDTDVEMEDRRLGYLPQKYALFPHMTVEDNIGFGVRDRALRQVRVAKLMDELSITHLASRKSPALSGGESQRVALGRALAIGPDALLLDEPMAALDPATRASVRQFLADRLGALAIPTLIVSHDVADAEALADRVVVLESGKVTQIGTLEEMKSEPASDYVREFFTRATSKSS